MFMSADRLAEQRSRASHRPATPAHRPQLGSSERRRWANVISIHHTFLGWAEEEGFIAENPSRMKRPPRRGANVYRPPTADVELGYRATTLHEREAWLLMGGLGLGAETVCKARWSDLDLRRGRISVKVKGGVTSVTGSDKRSPGGNHHPAQSP